MKNAASALRRRTSPSTTRPPDRSRRRFREAPPKSSSSSEPLQKTFRDETRRVENPEEHESPTPDTYDPGKFTILLHHDPPQNGADGTHEKRPFAKIFHRPLPTRSHPKPHGSHPRGFSFQRIPKVAKAFAAIQVAPATPPMRATSHPMTIATFFASSQTSRLPCSRPRFSAASISRSLSKRSSFSCISSMRRSNASFSVLLSIRAPYQRANHAKPCGFTLRAAFPFP